MISFSLILHHKADDFNRKREEKLREEEEEYKNSSEYISFILDLRNNFRSHFTSSKLIESALQGNYKYEYTQVIKKFKWDWRYHFASILKEQLDLNIREHCLIINCLLEEIDEKVEKLKIYVTW